MNVQQNHTDSPTTSEPIMGEKIRVALAFSGGLDTSVCLKLLQEKYNADVITVTVDVGQDPADLEAAAEKSRVLGAIKHYQIDAREEFVNEYVFRSIKANGSYEGYPLSSALARYLIASKLVEVAMEERCDAVAHGCTGKGNDQFRFDTTISIKAPEVKIIAPVRELNLDRRSEIAYAKDRGIPIPVDADRPYSVDQNLWGRSVEGGALEDIAEAPPEDIYAMTRSPAEAPADPRVVKIEFEKGMPAVIDGDRKGGFALIADLNRIAGEYGIGRIDMVEDRVLGLKSREVYEAPAATVLLRAHRALEQLVLTKDELAFKRIVEQLWAELAYSGRWFDPLREDLDAFINRTQERVCGSVRVELSRGSSRVVGLESPYSIYDRELVSFESSGFDQRESIGLSRLYALQSKILSRKLGK